MATLIRCPHCSADLPAFHDDPRCSNCGGDLFPAEAVSPPPVETAPAPAQTKPQEGPSALGSLGISLVIALMLGASFELISHKSAGAMFGNGTAVLITLIGALVI